MTACLRMPVFRRLLAAFAFNELAWFVGTLALAVLVYRRTGSALGTAAYFVCAQVLPALLAPAIVAHAERLEPRRVLCGVYLAEAVLFGALAYLARHFTLVPVLAVTVADGALAATGRSLASAARTEVLKPAGVLREGNTIASLLGWLAYMGGPVLGGAVVVAGGTAAALAVNSALFAAMALTLALTALPRVDVEEGSVLRRLRDGVAHAHADGMLARLIWMQTLGMVFFTITVPIEVVYTQRTLHAGPDGYGILMACWGGGCVLGSGIYARWRHSSAAALIAGGSLALGIGFSIMALAPSLPLALVGAAIAGIGNSVEWVAARTAVQERSPSQWMAIMMGFSESTALLAPGIGYLLGGALTAIAVSRVAFWVGGGGSLAFAALVPLVLGGAAARRAGASAREPEAAPGAAPEPDAEAAGAAAAASGVRVGGGLD
ncbi:MAG TPA: MFS transporter [Solirubrobacteraceae bacterium]|nr:MFS transporter [Solirubrobacteraceae bacterium]